MKTLGMTTVFSFILAFSLFAQDRMPRVDGRQATQRMRIAEGRRNGEVTRSEIMLLNRQQHRIRRIEWRAKADGEVTRAEHRRLHYKQNRAGKSIRRAKHNSL